MDKEEYTVIHFSGVSVLWWCATCIYRDSILNSIKSWKLFPKLKGVML